MNKHPRLAAVVLVLFCMGACRSNEPLSPQSAPVPEKKEEARPILTSPVTCDTSAFLAVYETYGLLSLTDPPSAEAGHRRGPRPRPLLAARREVHFPLHASGPSCDKGGLLCRMHLGIRRMSSGLPGRGGGKPIGGIKPTLDSVSPGAFPPVSGR